MWCLLEEEAVGIAAGLGPEDGQDEAEEEGEQSQPDHHQRAPLPGIPLAVPGLHQHDHPAHDEAVDEHNKVGLHHELPLAGAVDVGHATVLGLLNEGRAADVVPHLSGDHGEDEEEGDEGPGRPVVQELEVVAAEVEEPTDEGGQHEQGDGPSIVGRAEDTDGDLCTVSDPLGNVVGAEPDALDVHAVLLLGLSLLWEVHEYRGGVEVHGLEDVLSLVEVDHGEEEFV